MESADKMQSPSHVRPLSEGDWHAYLSATSAIDGAPPEVVPDPLATKRELALNYLGKRAQLEGAVYRRREPRILTSDLTHTLEENNRRQRYQRYPWLERLVSLMGEIERAQEEICLTRKVLPFPRNSAN
jgi:hypothetical protein